MGLMGLGGEVAHCGGGVWESVRFGTACICAKHRRFKTRDVEVWRGLGL